MSPPHTWEPVQEGLTEATGLLLDTKDILSSQGQRVKERRKRRRTTQGVGKAMPHPEPTEAKKKAPPPKNKPQAKEQEQPKGKSVEKAFYDIGIGYNKDQRTYISKRYGSQVLR